MKNIKYTIIFVFGLLISSYTLAQAIDPSILENLSPAQKELVKQGLIKSKTSTEAEPRTISESITKVAPEIFEDDLNGKKFGYNYFLSGPTTIAAVGDLPLPNDYKISLNDQFTVILSGSKNEIFDLSVKLDGSILFPELGSIYVVGETFQEVKNKLKNLIDQSYIGVQIDLSLKNLSAKKITIVGAVNMPGTYLVNPFTTISSALNYSGGILEIGTLRNIRLVRNNGDTYNFDLYKLLIDGDRSDDITIESGDVIVIDPARKFVGLSGEVRRPAIYEALAGETIESIINFGLGFTEVANESNISLNVLDLNSSSINTSNVSDLSLSLDGVLSITVNRFINKNIASIRVEGAIKEPGFYDIDATPTLEELIDSLEFVDVYPWLAVLEQFDDNNLVKKSVLFSLKDKNTYRSIKLLPNSKVYFANLNTRRFKAEEMTKGLIADYDLRINHKQGSFVLPVYGRYSVSSFIDLLGLDMSDVDNIATYISPLESIVIEDDYKNMQFTAKKYNTISFRSPINDLIRVTVKGAVDYPGEYTLQADTSVEDLYKMVGGFKKEAFIKGIIFTRQAIRDRQLKSIQKSKDDLNRAILSSVQQGENIGDINIIRALSQTIEPENLGRIAGDFSPGSSSSRNTILFDGDEIIVPRNPNAITVLGEVINPIAFEYSKRMTVRSAISNAGGYQDFANKRRVYVIKASGLIEQASKNIFVRNVNLEPGDTVVVPRKIITNNPGIDALVPLTNILSDLAFSAAALESLKNNN